MNVIARTPSHHAPVHHLAVALTKFEYLSLELVLLLLPVLSLFARGPC
jgi:hypothetical protein